MTAKVITRNVGIFDEDKKLIKYIPKDSIVTIIDDSPTFIGTMADKQYVKIHSDFKDGYILAEAIERNDGNG